MNVLMVGVGPKRVGGMWAVAEQYLKDKKYNSIVNLKYVSTSTNGSILMRIIYMMLGYIEILWTLHFKPVDILHIHMAEKGSTFRKGRVAKWGKQRGKKVIIHLHAGPFMAWYSTLSNAKKDRVKKIFGYADRVLVLGEYWKKELSEIVPDNRIIVLYNGVSCPRSNPYNSNARNIVYFGVMKKEKGIYDLIDAIKLIDDKLPSDVKVILCGNDLEGNIEETINNAGLNDRFELLGWVTGKKKEKVYRNAMISVLPSYYEGLSMTILEAMSQGIPIITTNISTMPEVLGDDGIMINPGDIQGLGAELLSLSIEKNKRIILSNSEISRIKQTFSEESFIGKSIDLYYELF